MPPIIAKVRAGYAQERKVRLATGLAKAIVESPIANVDASLGIDDIRPSDWSERVDSPDMLAKPATINKQPGYALPA